MAKAVDFLMKNNFLGDKTGQGFYKKVEKNGEREFWALDPKTLEYVPPAKVRFDSVGAVRKMENTGERIKALLTFNDRAAQYIWHLHAFYLAYASQMLGEIADDIQSIDNANKWGFAHEMGPFEIWDAIGVRETVTRMEADGYKVAPWVHEMLSKGCDTFYQRNASGAVIGLYDPARKDYTPVKPNERLISINQMRAANKEIDSNQGASLLDMGDGVLLCEFHTKANALDMEIFEMLDKGMGRLETDFDAMVIGNQGDFFSAGANLFLLVMAANSGQMDQIEQMIRGGQNLFQKIQYFPKPIVVAPFDRVLGGGCELTMRGARVVAHSELYIGLVEVGVGLIPGWGGCKEVVRRVISPVMQVQNADPLAPLQKAFEQIALAKVSTSAMEGRAMGYLSSADRIVMNKDLQLYEAKQTALELVRAGYTPPARQKLYAAGRDAKAALNMAVYMMHEGKYASDHDVKIATRLGHILCGGNLTAPAWVDEQYFLDLEVEAFLSLATEPKTMERIQHTLTTGKPLRN